MSVVTILDIPILPFLVTSRVYTAGSVPMNVKIGNVQFNNFCHYWQFLTLFGIILLDILILPFLATLEVHTIAKFGNV